MFLYSDLLVILKAMVWLLFFKSEYLLTPKKNGVELIMNYLLHTISSSQATGLLVLIIELTILRKTLKMVSLVNV